MERHVFLPICIREGDQVKQVGRGNYLSTEVVCDRGFKVFAHLEQHIEVDDMSDQDTWMPRPL